MKLTHLIEGSDHIWKCSGIMVDDHTIRTLDTLHLMCHEITSLVVHVVGHYKTLCKEKTNKQKPTLLALLRLMTFFIVNHYTSQFPILGVSGVLYLYFYFKKKFQ